MTKCRQAAVFLLFLLFVMAGATAWAAAPAVDGAPAYQPWNKQHAGLYVWRTWQGQWRVRLVGGSTRHSFTGSIWATRPFWSVSGQALEANDILSRPTPQAIKFTLNVQDGGQDGMDISLPADAGICLWGASTAGLSVYLGSRAVPANTPVDLLGTGACDGGKTVRKFNPGHYIALADWESQAHMLEAVRPGVVGIHKRYHWRELEPALGRYDFSRIESDLKLLSEHGMQLVVMIVDKTFDRTVPTPPYLQANFTLPTSSGGHVANRWAPYVVARMNALTAALGRQFDGHPNFEGIAFQESAPSLSGQVLDAHGYSPEKYRDALIDVLVSARNSFPQSQVFWYMNFMPRRQAYLADVAEAVSAHGVAMGGPDVLPEDASLRNMSYPFYGQFKGRMPLFSSLQYNSYGHLRADRSAGASKYWTMPQLFWYARDQLHVDYLFWTRKTVRSPSDSYDWTDALPVIRNNPVFNR